MHSDSPDEGVANDQEVSFQLLVITLFSNCLYLKEVIARKVSNMRCYRSICISHLNSLKSVTRKIDYMKRE